MESKKSDLSYYEQIKNFHFHEKINYFSNEFLVNNFSFTEKLLNISCSNWSIFGCLVEKIGNGVNKAALIINNSDIQEKVGDSVSITIDIKPKKTLNFVISSIEQFIQNEILITRIDLIHNIGLIEQISGFNVFSNIEMKDVVKKIANIANIEINTDKMPILDYSFPCVIQYNESLLNFLKRCLNINFCSWKNEDDGTISIGTKNNLGKEISNDLKNFIVNEGLLSKKEYFNEKRYENILYNFNNPDVLTQTSSKGKYKNTQINNNYAENQMTKKSTYLSEQNLLSKIKTYSFEPVDPYDQISYKNTTYYVHKSIWFIGLNQQNFLSYNELSNNNIPMEFQEINTKIQTATIIGKTQEVQVQKNKNYIENYTIQLHFDTNNTNIQVPIQKNYASQGACLLSTYLPGDLVLIDFLYGDINKPVIVGAMHNMQNLYPQNSENSAVGFYAPIETKPEFEESQSTFFYLVGKKSQESIYSHTPGHYSVQTGKGDIQIKSQQGNCVVLCENGDIRLETQKQNINISANNEINLKCKNLNFDVEENIKIKAKNSVEYNTQDFSIKTDNNFSLKSDNQIKLNAGFTELEINNTETKITSTSFMVNSAESIKMNSAQINMNGNCSGAGVLNWNGFSTFSAVNILEVLNVVGPCVFDSIVDCAGIGNFTELNMAGTPLNALFIPIPA